MSSIKLLIYKTTIDTIFIQNLGDIKIDKVTPLYAKDITTINLHRLNQDIILIYICPTILKYVDQKEILYEKDIPGTALPYYLDLSQFIIAITTMNISEYFKIKDIDKTILINDNILDYITQIYKSKTTRYKPRYIDRHPGYVGNRVQDFMVVCAKYTEFLYEQVFQGIEEIKNKKLNSVILKIDFYQKFDDIPLHVLQYGNVDQYYNDFYKRAEYFECNFPFQHVQRQIFDIYGFYLVDESKDKNAKFVLYRKRPKDWDKRKNKGLWHHFDYFDDSKEESEEEIKVLMENI